MIWALVNEIFEIWIIFSENMGKGNVFELKFKYVFFCHRFIKWFTENMTAHCVIKTPTRRSHIHFFVKIDPLSNEKLGILVKKSSKSVKPFSSYGFFVLLLRISVKSAFFGLKLHSEAVALSNIEFHHKKVCFFFAVFYILISTLSK